MTAIVETKEGRLQGVEEDALTVFRGVPFAKPPVGPLRFRPPQPAEPWSGVRVCDTFGFVAPQPQGQAMAGQGTPEEQNEDCLFLNVWTPACDDGVASGDGLDPRRRLRHRVGFGRRSTGASTWRRAATSSS